MAKRSKSRRVASANANRPYFSPKISVLELPVARGRTSQISYLNKLLKLREAEDRRLWTPTPHVVHDTSGRPIHTLRDKPLLVIRRPGLRTIHVVRDTPINRKRIERHGPLQHVLSNRIGFGAPERIMICVRRKRRKEVIFAKRFAGRGGRARVRFRAPRRNYYSQVDC